MSAPDEPLVTLRIRLPYAAEQEFIARYGSNVSRTGIFIASRAVKPVGTALAFELVLKTGEVLLRGEAVVAQSQADADGGRSGMTLRFVKLDPPSREFVDRMVAQRPTTPASTSPAVPSREVAPEAAAPPPPSPPRPSPERPGLSELSKRIDAMLAAPEEPATPSPREVEQTGHLPRAETKSTQARSTDAKPTSEARPPSGSARRAAMASDARTATPSSVPAKDAPNAGESARRTPTATPRAMPASAPRTTTPEAVPATARPPSAPPSPTAPTGVSRRPTPPGMTPRAPTAPTPSRAQAEPTERRSTPTSTKQVQSLPATPATPRRPSPLSSTVPPAPAPTPARVPPPPAPAPSVADEPKPVAAKAADGEGLAAPLSPPITPEPLSGSADLVLGLELAGTELRVAAESQAPGGGPPPLSAVPTFASFEEGRWYVGHAAIQRAGARPLFPTQSHEGSVNPEPAKAWLDRAAAELRLLAAHLIVQLRRHAEESLGKPVRDAVIALPSWFSHRDRRLLADACRLGGLQLRQIVHATSAACAAFAHGRGLARKRVLVLNPEARWFEVSVIQVTGEDLEVIATRCASAILGQELALEQVASTTREVLTAAGASATSLDEVIRFGDPAAMVRTQATLSELLARPLPEALDAQAAVRGAALLGHSYAELARGKRGGSVFEVLVSPLSLVQRNGALRRVLDVGTRLPAEKTLTLPLTGSECVGLILCDGFASALEEGVEVIGTATVDAGPLGGELAIRLAVDRNGEVTLSTSIDGGKLEALAITPAGDAHALLPLALPAETARKAGFLRGLVERIGKG